MIDPPFSAFVNKGRKEQAYIKPTVFLPIKKLYESKQEFG